MGDLIRPPPSHSDLRGPRDIFTHCCVCVAVTPCPEGHRNRKDSEVRSLPADFSSRLATVQWVSSQTVPVQTPVPPPQAPTTVPEPIKLFPPYLGPAFLWSLASETHRDSGTAQLLAQAGLLRWVLWWAMVERADKFLKDM